ncbi:MAG: hypothetical protein HUK19_09700 [Fibrobacter sp.]|nr:hypothetical protein [Fibrobacter sp.]
MKPLFFSSFLALFMLTGCTVERAEEHIVAEHANGAKKTSLWIYPSGEILKRNEWYSDGIKELEIPYKDSLPHGSFKRWTGYGDLVMEGEYKKGLRHGKWTSYYGGHFNKKTEAIRHYENDIPVGDWEGWHFNGERDFEEHYSDKGDSVGVWKRWNEDGSIAMETTCFGHTDSGYCRKYDRTGHLEQEYHCKNGVKHGVRKEFYGDGKKVQLVENWLDENLCGPRTFYYASGTIRKKEFWKNGRRDSVWQWFTPEGKLVVESKITVDTSSAAAIRTDYGICVRPAQDSSLQYIVCAESTFTDNRLDGALWYYKDGHELRYEELRHSGQLVKSSSYYPDTVRTATGDSIVFHRQASEGFWATDPRDSLSLVKRDLRNGVWRNWYPSGILRDSLNYVNGERVGEQFSYDSTGKLTIHKTENGKMRPVIMHLMTISSER